MQFEELRLIEPLLRAVRTEGYTTPTLIQEQAIPHVLDGRDLVGCAQTGTGKTAAFALPILQLLNGRRSETQEGKRRSSRRAIRSLVLTPTRELAAQIGESFGTYGQHTELRYTVVFGGVKQGRQVDALRKGVDILVATPGRLLDLLEQKVLSLRDIEIFVLDEADRMLDMGFIIDIRRVIAQLPPKRQNLLFSATMPQEIRQLAESLLDDPVMVRAASTVSVAPDAVDQALYFVESTEKTQLLEHLVNDPQVTRALVFTRTKRRADQVAKSLSRRAIASEAIHSNKSQNVRERALANFKGGKTRVLVASDIASRGLDIEDVSHVFNYDLPDIAEVYVHRIGRTGRAGASGRAISFCSRDQYDELRGIQRLLGREIPVLSHAICKKVEKVTAPKRTAERRSSDVLPSAQAESSSTPRRWGFGKKRTRNRSRRPRVAS